MQAMRQASQQNQLSFNGPPQQQNNCLNNINPSSNSAIMTNLQMNFDYNANGLELAGFCSPPGKSLIFKKIDFQNLIMFNIKFTAPGHQEMSPQNNNQIHQQHQQILHSQLQHQNQQSPQMSLQQQPQQSQSHQQRQQVNSSNSFYHYLTPTSQHSGGHTPQHLVQTLDSYPTPSPESPGHWSSSSPHSISDWSEVQSPANTLYVTAGGGHQSNKGSEAIYI